jgi:UDP-N-acetyl-D-mannosaminuronic acid dehydrogenase
VPLALRNGAAEDWVVRKICVIGPGIVGMPMAALLARAAIREGSDAPARVVVIQRPSPTSGWKVDEINAGRSPIGGVEPALARIVADTVTSGLLSASSDISDLRDADVILVCVQTDRKGIDPDYDPLLEALEGLALVLRARPSGNVPLIIIESTLAPSSMVTVIREHFTRHGLEDGRDILLGNSPNRVMPGRLVERVIHSDKVVAGLLPSAVDLIGRLYSWIVTGGTLHATNSLTAEVVKTLENAYRDVRIAFSAEIARWCDAHDVDFHDLRQRLNDCITQSDQASQDPMAVPSGGLLIPTTGVGGHCLPKDGILLWWRLLQHGQDTTRSLILEARRINDESPRYLAGLAERHLGGLGGRKVALLGVAYRFDSEDTRNSPTLPLARLLLQQGCDIALHDPYVPERDNNLRREDLTRFFTRDLERAVAGAQIVFICTGHGVYLDGAKRYLGVPGLLGVVDGCNLLRADHVGGGSFTYAGIGRGRQAPDSALVDHVERCFRAMETGVANEVLAVITYLNANYAADPFNRIELDDVRRIAATCVTGCRIAAPGRVSDVAPYRGLLPRLVRTASTIAHSVASPS